MYGTDSSKIKKKSVTANGITKEIEVTEAENGYIICCRTTDTNDDKYETTVKHYISKEDPFKSKEKEEMEITESSEMLKAIQNLYI